MAGTIIADYIRTDANKLSLNVGNTVVATINASGILSNTGTVIINQNGQINAASIAAGSIPSAAYGVGSIPAAAFSTSANTVPRSSMTTGSILQVVQSTKTSVQTIQSSSWTDISGLSVNITPTSSTSKFLVILTLNYASVESWNSTSVRLYRDTTPIFVGDAQSGYTQVSSSLAFQSVEARGDLMFLRTLNYVDSPGTTSTITYKAAVADFDDGGGPIYINRCKGDSTAVGRAASSIIVMEIA